MTNRLEKIRHRNGDTRKVNAPLQDTKVVVDKMTTTTTQYGGAVFCMNLFETVKQSVTTRQAAEYYGLQVNRFNKTCCPFHDDRTPSMKVDLRFHCFGCGADGDVIDFVSRLYGLDAKAAAEKLSADFQISYRQDEQAQMIPRTIKAEPDDRQQEGSCFRGLLNYLQRLRQWEVMYAPNRGKGTWHPLFVEALQEKDYIEYLLDVLLCGSNEEQAALIKEHRKEVMKLE